MATDTSLPPRLFLTHHAVERFAERAGISEGAARWRLHRALKKATYRERLLNNQVVLDLPGFLSAVVAPDGAVVTVTPKYRPKLQGRPVRRGRMRV